MMYVNVRMGQFTVLCRRQKSCISLWPMTGSSMGECYRIRVHACIGLLIEVNV